MSASLIACTAPRRTWSKTTADVIVIGAGLAGLHATWQLEQTGLKVILLEGNSRTGGRLYTLDNLPGAPDAGGVQIGAAYKRFNTIADRLDVERYLPESGRGGYLYNVRGQNFLKDEWPSLPQNRLADGEKGTSPDALFFSYMRKLPTLETTADWMSPEITAGDVSLASWLKAQGASDEAMRFMNANLNGRTLEEMSMLHMQRTLSMFGAARKANPGPTRFIRGGSQRMTDAMTNTLNSDIILNAPVSAIEDEGDGVEVTLVDGRKYGARHVICTAPFSTVRNMKIEAALPLAMRNTIRRLPYTKASFVFLRASDAFWKEDGLPEYIWSDDPLIGRVFTLNSDPPLLKIWVNGPAAEALDSMDPQRAAAEIITRIEKIRPSAKGKLSYLDMFSWQKEPFARGIYHHIGTGVGAALASTVQHQGERLHFAGEHMTQNWPGMEGALETAERATSRVLALA
ncbi:flavin monoamine oxidase family protein [Parasphingorhabdus litoris]|uniref:Tryptophan 2-monooxygenase n=2 Tax=Parasphingorhabdus litoris TaxID=394733 RepID=A0ABP3KXG9_9SPHN